MKSFKVIDSHVKVDGVIYRSNPSNDVNIKGKLGTIHSINIEGRGQFFPIDGIFDDGSVKVVDSTTDVLDETTTTKRTKATKMVETNGVPTDINGKPIKKAKKK